MSSRRRSRRGEPIPRTVERCEMYLDHLALVVERAGSNGAAFLPIVRRLERELAEAREEADLLQRLHQRRARPTANEDDSSIPDNEGNAK